ncbi:hypothetical protein [Streptomyces sp. NPDC048577]|uniref:hypothetical protein n=1 Tax=Streptomyces sp. NPDC048577 TaxID=3157209 RepID=UPI003423AD13
MKTRTSQTAHGIRPLARPARLVAAGAAVAAVLTGCGGASGGASGGGKDVASLPTQGRSGPAAKSGPADPDAGRPQIRLDSTQEDIERMWDAEWACLEQQAGPDYKQKITAAHKQGKTHPAEKACLSKEPLSPPELDPARNPHYADGAREMVNCMTGKGFKAVVDPESGLWGLVHGADQGAPGFDDAQRTCQIAAFGGNK